MVKIVLTLVVASLVGFAFGRAQVYWAFNGVPEYFYLPEQSAATPSNAAGEQARSGIPKIELVDGNSFNFGQMRHGSSMSHSFALRNVGDGPLHLEKKGSTCKCTVGELADSVLMPGKETTITLEWRAQTISARFGQTATFKTNDPENTELQLVIEGSVIDSFVFEPTQIDLGDFAPDAEVSKEFMIFCYADEDVELSRLIWSNPATQRFVNLEFTPATPDPGGIHAKASKAYSAKLTVSPGMPIGLVASKISFLTNHGEQIDLLEMNVNGRVISDISIIGGANFVAERNLLDIGNLAKDQEFSTKIWIKLSGQQQEGFELTVEQQDAKDSLNVTVGEAKVVGKSKLIPIQFDVPKGAAEAYYPGNEKGSFAKVLIRSNSNKLPELPVFVKLVVTK